MRLLLIKMSSLGDVIHTLPALTDAQAALPQLSVDWVVEEAFAELPALHSAVDRVIPIALRRWRRTPLRSLGSEEWRQFRAALRAQQYDRVLDAQGLVKSAVVSRLVAAPRGVPEWRSGPSWRSAREPIASLAYGQRIVVPPAMHAVQRTRLLFATTLGYALADTPPHYALQVSASPGKSRPDVLFCHGSSRADKLWPEAHWVDLARRALAAGLRIGLPWGSERERDRAERLARAAGERVEVLPQLRLGELAGLLTRVRGVVAVDTGLGHLCAALGVPAVSLYGPTDPALIGTLGENQVHVLATPHERGALGTMQDVSPEDVWQQLQRVTTSAVAPCKASG